MLNITHYQRNANQNHNEVPSHASQNAAAAKSRQSCSTLCNLVDRSPPGSRPWDSPGNSTGVGCHFLLQHMKVKSEREVAQLSTTLCDPMNCSLPGSSVHGISQVRVMECVATPFPGDLPNPGIEPVSPALAGRFFTTESPRKPHFAPYLNHTLDTNCGYAFWLHL